MCVFCLDSTVVVLINWPHEPWTEVMTRLRAHPFSFHGPFCSGHTDNLIHCYLRPQDVKAVCANLARIMTLNDVSHDLLPSIAWDYYIKNLGVSFVILVLQVIESRRKSYRPVCRFYRSCVYLKTWFSWCFLFGQIIWGLILPSALQLFMRTGLHDDSFPCFSIHIQVTTIRNLHFFHILTSSSPS